jgi:drug/metabolite transporter (DMT)-like permease
MRALRRWSSNRMAVGTVGLGILFAFGASASYASEGFVASQVIRHYSPGLVLAAHSSTFGMGYLLALWGREFRKHEAISRVGLFWIALAGLGLAMGTSSLYSALGEAPLSVVAPIVGAVPLVSYVFVLLLLRGQERITPRVLLGASLVVAGVVLISIYNV